HRQYARGERGAPHSACRPLPLGMSYPLRRTVHAAYTGSLRYGRTTPRRRALPHSPESGTKRTRVRTERNPTVLREVARGMVVTVSTGAGLPGPRRPLASGDRIRAWYEHELSWPTAPGPGPRLVVGVRFDVLDVPAEAGHAALAHFSRAGEDAAFPVAAQGGRLRLLVAPGSAEEVPGLLDWLEWGGLTLDLVAIGAGGLMDAPPPPGRDAPPGAAGTGRGRPHGCGPPERGTTWSPRCRRGRRWGAVAAPPIWRDW